MVAGEVGGGGDQRLLHYSLTGEKFFILLGMFACTVVFGFLPRSLTSPSRRADPRWQRAVSALSCFSGGVFIGACLLDLFPDVRESFDHILDEIQDAYHTTVDYPVAEFVIVQGFFLVLLVEQIVLEFGFIEDPGRSGRRRGREGAEEGERTPLLQDGGGQGEREGEAEEGEGGGGGGGGGGDAHPRTHGTFNGQHRAGEGDRAVVPDVSLRLGAGDAVDGQESQPVDGQDHHHHHHHVVLDHSSLRSYLLLVALTFHSVFEGLAIGLQEVSGQLFSIFTAVIIHKGVMAFSLGLTIAQSPRISMRNFAISILTFSASSPVGMAAGIALTDMEQSLGRDIANGVLQGLAGGTFLYITFFEVLPSELGSESKHKYSRMLKFFFVILGYSCICGILFFTH